MGQGQVICFLFGFFYLLARRVYFAGSWGAGGYFYGIYTDFRQFFGGVNRIINFQTTFQVIRGIQLDKHWVIGTQLLAVWPGLSCGCLNPELPPRRDSLLGEIGNAPIKPFVQFCHRDQQSAA